MAINYCPNCGSKVTGQDGGQGILLGKCITCDQVLSEKRGGFDYQNLKRSLIAFVIVIIILLSSWWLQGMLAKFSQSTILHKNIESLQPKILQLAKDQGEVFKALTSEVDALRGQIQLMSPNGSVTSDLSAIDVQAIRNMQSGWLKSRPLVLNVYAAFHNDLMILVPEQELPPDYSPTMRPWYMDMVENPITQTSAPYHDILTGDMTATITAPIVNTNKPTELIGVLGIDYNLTQGVQAIADFTQTMDSSAAFIQVLDNTGIIIYSSKTAITAMPTEIGSIVPFAEIQNAVSSQQDSESTIIEYVSLDSKARKQKAIVAPIANSNYAIVAYLK